ncbi:carnitine/acyl carnitine carrier [Histoplasma capsulatum var. duboisii H88]|uniref:Carnitine/acyl carnitine carrier n=2 Tax=Ajellomyces capsulatus (strain H88) TaxID=544711 RepID=A0A8A1L3N9_AJEC8|nr:carnitine/acyl carnitine carrier [Histoplasma capsulatum var. duboisii H88]
MASELQFKKTTCCCHPVSSGISPFFLLRLCLLACLPLSIIPFLYGFSVLPLSEPRPIPPFSTYIISPPRKKSPANCCKTLYILPLGLFFFFFPSFLLFFLLSPLPFSCLVATSVVSSSWLIHSLVLLCDLRFGVIAFPSLINHPPSNTHDMPSTTTATSPSLPMESEPQKKSPAASNASVAQIKSFVAGGAGGICAVIVGHPFDLVKVRLQTAEKGVYSGAIHVVKRTIAREGLARGLYAGVSAPLVGVTPMFAVSFWGYDLGKTLVRNFSSVPVHNGTPQYTIGQISAAGFFSAIPMTLITAPFERVKVLLQIQGQNPPPPGQKPKYSGGVDVVRQLYKEGGIRSVFRGSAMTLARDGPGSAAYFAAYEYIKRSLTPKDVDGNVTGELSLPAVVAAGGAAGIAMWIPVFPIDTVKSRLQSAEGRPTIGGTIRGVYANGGFKAFFPGFGPALARAVPANAATFLGVELAHKAMDKFF